MNSGNVLNTPRDYDDIRLHYSTNTKIATQIISEEIRRVKQALYKHNEIENNTVL